MGEDIIHCKDCEFCEKSNCWKWCEYMGVSPWHCTKGRGLDKAETVNPNDFCSSARIKEIKCDFMIKDKTSVTCDRCKNDWILDPSDVSAWCQKNMVAIDDYGNSHTVGEITTTSTRYEICRNCYDKFKTFMGFDVDESKVMISMPMPTGCIKCPALNEDCEHYKAYAVHGHSGAYIYACQLELSRNPCMFKYVETPIESRLQKDNMVNEFIAYANAAFDTKFVITPSEVSSDSFESLFGKLYMENNKYE